MHCLPINLHLSTLYQDVFLTVQYGAQLLDTNLTPMYIVQGARAIAVFFPTYLIGTSIYLDYGGQFFTQLTAP